MEFAQLNSLLSHSSLLGQQGFINKQTHISSVFIGQTRVIKIKKPVNFGFVDYSTLEMRKKYCELEVTLNRRMSENIYLGASSLHHYNGNLFFDQQTSEAIEYAVIMNRIPDDMLLDRLIFMSVSPGNLLDKIRQRLAQFYSQSPNDHGIQRYGSLAGISRKTDENFNVLQTQIGTTIEQDEYDTLSIITEAIYKKYGAIFDERAQRGKIYDGHGDLRLEHLCFSEGHIHAIDCIEFNESLRCCDILNDIAFLFMDMDFHGFDEFSRYLEKMLLNDFSEGSDGPGLVIFYKLYRALVRAKVEGLLIADEGVDPLQKDEAYHRARKYVELALGYADELSRL